MRGGQGGDGGRGSICHREAPKVEAIEAET